jgi:calcium-translocating P-type ATPase
MKKMLRAGVLVRRLVGIETAGNLNILFTDKTGTLTCGKLKVASIVSADTSFDSITSLKKSPAFYSALRQNHLACTGTGRGNATDRAVSAFFSGCGGDRPRVLHRVPFDSARRYSSGCVEDRTLIRGAPEVILPQVTRYLAADGRVRPMTPAVMAKLRREWQEYAAGSHRVIAAAEYDGVNTTDNGDFADLIFVALIAIRDRLRPDAADAVATARQAGIQTVMITGDNPLTAEAIARECGIIAPGGPDLVLTGEMLSRMTDEEVSAKIPRIAVVARALPTDKSRLVRLSQQRGLVVGMTGDGINDAPALRAADVGFAMGSGTDAAREAGDIVITDDRFSSIMQAVLYGRTIFLSIRKFIVFQLTMNLCAVGVSLIGPFIGVETPVTVIQMLWVNIIMDTLGALAFAGEPSLAKYMHRPPLSREEKLLSHAMIQNIWGAGGFSLALCLWFLKSPLMHRVLDRGDEVYYLTVFFALFIFCGLFNCFLSRTERMNIFAHLADNKPFILIVCTVCVVQLMIIYFGGDVFRCEPLTAREILIAALLAG